MVRRLLFIFTVLFTLVIAGCNLGDTQSSTSLVVDLPAVARALGRDEIMTRKLDQARQQLSDQLTQISSELEQQLKDKETELEKTSKKQKEESRKELEQLTLQANLQLKKTQQLANQKAVLFRDQLVSEFRDEVLASAEKIARERNAVTIFMANNDLLWYSDSIDITDEVIGAMRARANDPVDESGAVNNVAGEQEQGAEPAR